MSERRFVWFFRGGGKLLIDVFPGADFRSEGGKKFPEKVPRKSSQKKSTIFVGLILFRAPQVSDPDRTIIPLIGDPTFFEGILDIQGNSCVRDNHITNIHFPWMSAVTLSRK